MLEALLWIGKIVLFSMAAYVIFGLGVFIMFNIAPRTERRVRRNANNKVLTTGVTLEERASNMAPWDYCYSSLGDKSLHAQEATLQDDNTLRLNNTILESEQHNRYLLLEGPGYAFAFKNNTLFWVRDRILGHEEKAWRKHNLQAVTYAAAISTTHMLIEAEPPSQQSNNLRYLYQVNIQTLEIHRIETTPYYTFNIPPKRFIDEATGVIALVYYRDNYSYSFGGDCSRPQKSIVRLYGPQHPEGRDIAEISFASGMVIDVAFEQANKLVLIGDPSRPASYNKPRLAPRVWVLTLPN